MADDANSKRFVEALVAPWRRAKARATVQRAEARAEALAVEAAQAKARAEAAYDQVAEARKQLVTASAQWEGLHTQWALNYDASPTDDDTYAIALLEEEKNQAMKRLLEAEEQAADAAHRSERATREAARSVVNADNARRIVELAERKRTNASAKVRRDHPWIASLPDDQAQAAERTMRHVDRAFRFVSMLVPKRIGDEEIGDSVELMAEHFKHSTQSLPVYLMLATTVFWVVVNTVRHLMGSRTPKASGG
jgi:hypothetical protein